MQSKNNLSLFQRAFGCLWLMVALAFLAGLLHAASAQETSSPVVVEDDALPFDPGTADLPTGSTQFWTWGISLVTPVIIWGVSKIPMLPRPVLPLLTPLVGILLGMGLRALGELQLTWVDMAQAGAVAVFIRESVNQVVTKQLHPLEESKTNAKPVDGAVAVKDTVTRADPTWPRD